MNDALPLLLRRFLCMYGATGIVCFLLFNSYNILVDGSTLSHIMRYDVYVVLLECFATVVLLQGFTYVQLRKLDQGGSEQEAGSDWDKLRLLFRFPMLLFGLVVICGVILSVIYHIAEVFIFQIRSLDAYVIQHLLIELSLSLTIGMLFYALARKMLHPYIKRYTRADYRSVFPSSFIRPLLLTYGSVILVSVFALIWLTMNDMEQGRSISLGLLAGIACMAFLLGTTLFSLLLFKFRRDMLELTDSISFLLNSDRSELYAKIPIVSPYETGELAAAFNEMQRHFRDKHEQLEKQLRLAKQTQQKLLPTGVHFFGPFTVQFVMRLSSDVHGELLDVQALADGRIIVMAGCVSETKGMPAAVVMSAALMLFRLEAKHAVSVSELLTTLNNSLWDTLQGGMTVSMTLGLFDPMHSHVTIASAGCLPVLGCKAKQCLHEEGATPPLGTDVNLRVKEWLEHFGPEERFVFAAGSYSEDDMPNKQASYVTVMRSGGET